MGHPTHEPIQTIHRVPPDIRAVMGFTGSPGVQQILVQMEVPPPTHLPLGISSTTSLG